MFVTRVLYSKRTCHDVGMYAQADRKTALAQNGLAAQLSKPSDKGSSYADLDFSDVSITSVCVHVSI